MPMSPDAQRLDERQDFADLVRVVANERGILPELVEKDYWVMHCLWGLQQQGYSFELKGGTSLSKGFQAIDRFSEDIDIRIEPPAGASVSVSRKQRKPQQIQSRKAFFDKLAGEISIPGITDVSRDEEFDELPDYGGAGIRLTYDKQFLGESPLKEGVLLEVGFAEVDPNQARMISSWLVDRALETNILIFDNRAVDVLCYLPEYTLVEKLQAIVRKFIQQQSDGNRLESVLRHYYDIYQLLGMYRVQQFIGTARYIEKKNREFSAPHAENLSDALALRDPSTQDRYKAEYVRTAALYFDDQVPFDGILARIDKYSHHL